MDHGFLFMELVARQLFFQLQDSKFLEKQFEKLTLKFRITLCLILTTLFTVDEIYSLKYPHQGEGITNEANFESQNEYGE